MLRGLCQFPALPASAAPRSVFASGRSERVSTPTVNAIPTALQSSSARLMFGRCPLKSARKAFSGRPASVAARLGPQPRRFSCACTMSASRWLAGSVGFLFICVPPSVLDAAVFRWAVLPRPPASVRIWCLRRASASGPSRRSRMPLAEYPSVCRVPEFPLRRYFALSVSRLTVHLSVRAPLLAVFRNCLRDVRASATLVSTDRETLRSPRVLRGDPTPACWMRGAAVTEVNASIDFLRERIAGLDRQRARLARALEALQDEPPPPVPASPELIDGASTQEEPPPLATQILAVLRKSGPLNRRQLLRAFEHTDVKAGTLDSAVYRLKDRGLLDKRGDRFGVVEPQAVVAGTCAGAGASSASDRSSGPVGAAVEPLAPSVSGDPRVVPAVAEDRAPAGTVPRAQGPDEDNAVPLAVRVYRAVVAGVADTRLALVRHFAPQGFSASQVDTALSGCRKRGKLKSVGRGKIVVVGSGASPEPADGKRQGF